jgi:hypothetical protein
LVERGNQSIDQRGLRLVRQFSNGFWTGILSRDANISVAGVGGGAADA